MEILKLENLEKHFEVHSRSRVRRNLIRAVDGVSLAIPEGEIHSIVGESGSGKTTLGRMVAGLLEPTSGSVVLGGVDMFRSGRGEIRNLRKSIQIIFQDPYASLNPRFTVRQILEEPLRLNRLPVQEGDLLDTLRQVGLTPPEDFTGRYPHELSGGQRQRVAIARAMIVRPRFIVADEPVSMLDASMRGSFLQLILSLRKRDGITMMMITHDISIAHYVSDRISIFYRGKVVEQGRADDVVLNPAHPYTRALIESVPSFSRGDSEGSRHPEVPSDVPDPATGCMFRNRCPKAMVACEAVPGATEIAPAHFVSCHLYGGTGVK